jgi:flagellar basal-body rod modification protein FlgD
MPVNGVSSPTTNVQASTQSVAEQSLSLGKDAFLKMMVENLRQQDPTNAADSKEFVNQLSQMTSLEQITKMANATASLAAETRDARAVGMLGKTIGYLDGDETRQEGVVGSVVAQDGVSYLKVGETLVSVAQVVDVRES